MTGFDIRLERLVNAAPERAFTHWVDAEARRRWYAPDDGWIAEAETDLRVGGSWRVEFGPTRDEMYLEYGVFLEIDPPRRVVYSTIFDYPDGRASFETVVTVTFEARDGGTLMRVLDAGYPSEAQRDANESGWPDFIDAYERTLESSVGRQRG